MFLLFFFVSVKEAKAEWKKLRDNHRDSLKRMKTTRSGQAATNSNTWKYAEVMEFLLPYMKNRSRSTNFNSTNTQLWNIPESPEMQDDENTKNSEISAISTINNTAAGVPQEVISTINNTEAGVPQEVRTTRKRNTYGDFIEFLKEMEQNHLKRQEDRHLTRTMANVQKEKNAIDLFLENMAITIKTMPNWMQKRIK